MSPPTVTQPTNALMKNFTVAENVSSMSQVKSSVARGIKEKLLEQYPRLEHVIEEILPKKPAMQLVKCKDRVTFIYSETEGGCFFQERDGPWFPTLRLLHKFPSMMKKMQVDAGGIKFMLNGANVMVPGLTSEGGRMEDAGVGEVVQICAEGKVNAMAVGILTMSTAQIKKESKGFAITNVHYQKDGLFKVKEDDWK